MRLGTSTQASRARPQCPEWQQEDPDRALTERGVTVTLDNRTLGGLSAPHCVEFSLKHPEAGLGGCVRVRSPGRRDPRTRAQWSFKAGLLRGSWLGNPEPHLPPAPRPVPVTDLGMLCFSAIPTYLGVPAAGLEGASGLLKGFWRAD